MGSLLYVLRIHISHVGGHDHVVDVLLRNQALLDTTDEDNRTAFDVAVNAGKIVVAGMIKKKMVTGTLS